MQDMINNITSLIGNYVPNLLGAIAILVIGWIVASIIAGVVKSLLKKTDFDNKIAAKFGETSSDKTFQLEHGISRSIFWFLMLFVLVAFFQALQLTIITQPLNNLLDKVLSYLPQLLGAVALFLIAWFLATILRKLITSGLHTFKLDEKINEKTSDNIPLSKSLGDIAYWLVFLIFLPGILGALNLGGILEPIQGMLHKILDFLPNVLTAGVIVLVGWFVAKIIRQIVTSLLSAIGTDNFSEKIGLNKSLGSQKLSSLIGMILYILILIPILIAGLNALKLDAITRPASNMLNQILQIIPAIFAAAVILAISYVIAKVLSGFIENLLSGIGFDNLFVKLGLQKENPLSGKTPSKLVGYIILVTIMLFAFIEAFNTLGFEKLSEMVSQFTVLGGHILFGIVILGVGLFFANLAADVVKESSVANSNILATVARFAIIILAGAMALRQMGLANEIINMAFGLLLGAIAVAAAIAFGIGGRDLAAKKLSEWNNSLTKK